MNKVVVAKNKFLTGNLCMDYSNVDCRFSEKKK